MSASVGKYATVGVTTGGVVQITYSGNSVNQSISGSTLALTPYTDTNNDILWVCGTAKAPTSATTASNASASNSLSARYLPQSCHS
jgi:type IV pilus assembly protein PilA